MITGQQHDRALPGDQGSDRDTGGARLPGPGNGAAMLHPDVMLAGDAYHRSGCVREAAHRPLVAQAKTNRPGRIDTATPHRLGSMLVQVSHRLSACLLMPKRASRVHPATLVHTDR
jgi:hypothetical protein